MTDKGKDKRPGDTQKPSDSFSTLEDYLEQAEHAADRAELERAIEILRRATRLYPDSAEAAFDLGVALFMKLEAKLAHLDLWENLAEDEDLVEECVRAFETAIECNPQFAPAYTNLGNLAALRGDRQRAVELWSRSLQLDPNQPEVADNLERYRQMLSTDEGQG